MCWIKRNICLGIFGIVNIQKINFIIIILMQISWRIIIWSIERKMTTNFVIWNVFMLRNHFRIKGDPLFFYSFNRRMNFNDLIFWKLISWMINQSFFIQSFFLFYPYHLYHFHFFLITLINHNKWSPSFSFSLCPWRFASSKKFIDKLNLLCSYINACD